jgi:predicted nucleic acid-binding protein
LPDIDDEPFLEVALASGAECLVTGNKLHFPAKMRQGVKVLSPREFSDFYKKQQERKNT